MREYKIGLILNKLFSDGKLNNMKNEFEVIHKDREAQLNSIKQEYDKFQVRILMKYYN